MSEPNEIMTTDEAADMLRVPKRNLYRWMQQGDSPLYYVLGKHVRWKRREVQAWFDAKSITNRSP